eukprot:10977165-Karenia_brevis.AAC.1
MMMNTIMIAMMTDMLSSLWSFTAFLSYDQEQYQLSRTSVFSAIMAMNKCSTKSACHSTNSAFGMNNQHLTIPH